MESPASWGAMAQQTFTLAVQGMTCGGCARTVERSVQEVPGVLGATVDLPSKTVRVEVDPARAGRAAVEDAVVRAGYAVRSEVR